MDRAAEQTPDNESILSTLVEIVRPYSKADDVTLDADTPIEKLGIDSFDFVEIVFKLEETFGIDIDYNVNSSFKSTLTIGQLVEEVARQIPAKTSA